MTSPPSDKNQLIVIAGPTASGKTRLGVKLAQYYNTEVISADSRQFYRDMQIGTARPTTEQLQEVPHHFLGFLDLETDFSAGQFAEKAALKIQELFEKHRYVIVVGGSGFYIDALIYGLDDLPKINPAIRNKLNKQLEDHGLVYLQDQLRKIDKDHFHTMDHNNPIRVIRALEVYEQSGQSISFFHQKETRKPLFNVHYLAIETDRNLLYQQINSRVDRMIDQGLVEEAKKLYSFKVYNALQTVGYRELFDHFDNKISLNEAIELIKRNTRRFAKRQLTWLRNQKDVHWVNPSKEDKIIAFIENNSLKY